MMVGQFLAFCSVVSCSVLLARALVAPTLDQRRGESAHVSHDASENKTDLDAHADICRCCWRDCEHDSEEEIGLERVRVSGRSRLRIEGAEDVDAWLLMANGNQRLERNMYTPILETVRYGLRNVARDVRIIDANSIEAMLDGISGGVAKGKRPLVMAAAWWWSSLTDIRDRLKDASARGAYLVLYNTEPAPYDPYARGTAEVASETNAHEIWDYALSNVAQFPKTLQIPVRYIPPGYAPGLDVGVDQNSPSRDETQIGYMGQPGKPMYPKYEEQFHEKLQPRNSITTRAALKDFLEAYPVQLSMHKSQTCCPRDPQEKLNMQMEAFRFAELLANKACVISPPGSDADNQRWASTIHIVEVEDTRAEFNKLERGVRACQENSFQRFRADFDAEKLLAQSGFLHAWVPGFTPDAL